MHFPLWLHFDRPLLLRIIVYALMSGMVTLALVGLTGAIRYAYFNDPPIELVSRDPANLGMLCPGDELYAHTKVSIHKKIIVIFYMSTLDVTGSHNMIGTQSAFTDLLHPRPSTFEQALPWTVPDIPPGRYRRVIAARNVARNENTVFVEAIYEIGEDCP